ncbi:MAG: hydrolase [Planctomycetaceae bacterium]|nr:hydrolase [Planctomycetaceae bacterium]
MRLTPARSTLCVIDVQEKLIPTIPTAHQLTTECCRLIEAATLFGTHVIFTEQYRKGLGPTVAPLATKFQHQEPIEKKAFSCCGSTSFMNQIPSSTETFVLCGIETHICIAQTALDLLQLGYHVCLAADAAGSRREQDHRIALRRLEGSGAVISTTEAILFEWCNTAENPAFQKMRELISKE